MTPRVVLVGLPGAGKSVTGRHLARRLHTQFADSDDLVAQAEGRSVQQIFAADGEAAFREVEAAVVAKALADFDGVLCLGGGAVTTAATRQLLADAGMPVVFLRATMGTLLSRIGDGASRPLLAGSPAARLAEIAHVREPVYRRVSTLAIDTNDRTPDRIAAAIVELMRTP